MKGAPTSVTCYSGHTYAERPKSFLWEGAEQFITEIEKEWREPGERHFTVRTGDDRQFELCYYDSTDRWLAIEMV